jgi:chemotaxis protein CheC
MIDAQAKPYADGLARLLTVAELGMARAGEGLSEMTGTPIEVIAPSVRIIPLGDVPALVGDPDTLMVGIYLSMLGDLTGHVILMFPYPSALALVDALLELPEGTTVGLDPMAESALGEVGNLTGSFFLNALSDNAGLKLQPSPPAVAVDMTCAILDAVLADLGQYGEDGLMIDTYFKQSDKAVSGFFLVFPDRPSLCRLVEWMGR